MPDETEDIRGKSVSFYEKTNKLLFERRTCMTLSTFAAGLLITVVAAALELMDKDHKKEKEEFENS